MTSSTFEGCTTGKPAGWAPRRDFTDIEVYLPKSVAVLSVADQSTGFCKFATAERRLTISVKTMNAR
jgi:hypothetical protein